MLERFEVYRDNVGGYRWRLKSNNGEVVARSEESYATKASCLHAIDLVKRIAASALVSDLA
jgi:uncharacterized protein YegP (UPF0339 family)